MFRRGEDAVIDLDEEVEPTGLLAEIPGMLTAMDAAKQDDVHPDRHDHRDCERNRFTREPRGVYP